MMITKDMLIQDVIAAYPETREIFAGLGMACLDCLGASLETIETGARMHGLQVSAVLKALVEAVELRERSGRQE